MGSKRRSARDATVGAVCFYNPFYWVGLAAQLHLAPDDMSDIVRELAELVCLQQGLDWCGIPPR